MKKLKQLKQTKVRDSNFELLRIIAMIMIVIYHIVCHCVIIQLGGESPSSQLFNHPMFYKKLFLINGTMTWGLIGNAIFLLISGYFMVRKNKTIDINKIAKKLLLQLGFVIIILTISSTIVFKISNRNYFFDLLNINLFNSMSWYVGYYFLIILLAYLFLNKYLLKLDNKNYITFLLIIFAITQFTWTSSLLEGIASGLKTVTTGVFLYSLGGYISLYNPFEKVRTSTLFIIIVVANILIYLSSYNITQTEIQKFLMNNINGDFIQKWLIFDNNNILVIILGICMFEIFKRIKIPPNKIINFLSSGAFMVYLLHDNSFFYSIWKLKDWIKLLYNSPFIFLLNLLMYGIITFLLGILIYILYLGTVKFYRTIKWVFIKN